jgi:hypothetical protein
MDCASNVSVSALTAFIFFLASHQKQAVETFNYLITYFNRRKAIVVIWE